MMPPRDDGRAAIRLWLSGRVQGVGFRPFVYRLGCGLGLAGWVRNRSGQVEIQVCGAQPALARFQRVLLREAPPPARPYLDFCETIPPFDVQGFSILDSAASARADVHLPRDEATCDECLRELRDPRNRRGGYPFINCTRCGPRFTLLEQLPYDRRNTSMAEFALCPPCRAEYQDPLDRRFHAEALACVVCGPALTFAYGGGRSDSNASALTACVAALRAGTIVAVKGIGGYHLMCDATQTTVVARLRALKPRPHKPFAVMFPAEDDFAALRAAVDLDIDGERCLLDPARPIVLIRKRDTGWSEAVAPGLSELGVMLPYSPLHHLLLDGVGRPLLATSANVSGEPVFTEGSDVEIRLRHVAEACLHHNRPIVRQADDPIVRVIAGRARALRLGRGNAPLEWMLTQPVARPTLALGGHTKNTVAIAWGSRAVISPHIGTLDSPRSLTVFERAIADLQNLYGVRVEHILCDAHPGYAAMLWAKRAGLPVSTVFHHHAHASALAGEYPEVKRWLVFTWDGVGYGEDGTLWGGEALLGAPGHWRRVATVRPFHLPGGDRAAREPWRSACALAWETGGHWSAAPAADALRHAWRRRLNTPATSAVGRLFDAAAALLGLAQTTSFEAQAPMLLETAARRAWPAPPMVLPVEKNNRGLWEIDWAGLLPRLLDDAESVTARAATFHASLARALLETARRVRAEQGHFSVGLTGGVFQNRLLAEHALAQLAAAGFDARLPEQIPANDAGLSFGQLIEATRMTQP